MEDLQRDAIATARVIIFRNLVLQIAEKEMIMANKMNERKREISKSKIHSLLAGDIHNDENTFDDNENENENEDTMIEILQASKMEVSQADVCQISQVSPTGQVVQYEEQEEINNGEGGGRGQQSSMNQFEFLCEIQAQV